jgi:hypothetical protein
MNIKTNSVYVIILVTVKLPNVWYCCCLMQLASCLNPTSAESCKKVAASFVSVSIWLLVASGNKFSILYFRPKEFGDTGKSCGVTRIVNGPR